MDWRLKPGNLAPEETEEGIVRVVAWCDANDLRAMHIHQHNLFVEGDTIRFREIVPAEEVGADERPRAVLAPTPEDEWAELVGEWQTKPLKVAPAEFGLEVLS